MEEEKDNTKKGKVELIEDVERAHPEVKLVQDLESAHPEEGPLENDKRKVESGK